MKKLNYNIIAKVRFFSEKKGGRKSPTPKKIFGCPMVIKNNYYDCRLVLNDIGSIKPGNDIVVPIIFLDPQTVLPIIKKNDKFELWDGGIIAEGKVLKINK